MRPAAGVVPVREVCGELEVLMVHRSRTGRFFPGFWAFPGGGQEPGDALARPAFPQEACALRELLEETGAWTSSPGPTPAERAALLAGRLTIADLLERYPVSPLIPAGLRITPDYSSIRFTAQFFLACLPPGVILDVQLEELEEVRWWNVRAMLGAWQRGEVFLAAPTQVCIEQLAAAATWQAAGPSLEAVSPFGSLPIPVCPGLSYVPLVTPTLPPARHTLAFLLAGERLLIVDPGSSDPFQLGLLEAAMPDLPVEAVVFSHHHPDHIGGQHWARERGYPIWAHADTPLDVQVDRLLVDGERLVLSPDWTWEVLHTPGHAAGHLAFWNAQRRILLPGDLVSGLSTILVIPGQGTMSEYLASLQRCQDLDPALVLPAHGGPYGPGSDLLGKTYRHRLAREAKVLDSLSPAWMEFDELLARAYDDCPPESVPVARLSLESHVVRLIELRQAERDVAGRLRVAR